MNFVKTGSHYLWLCGVSATGFDDSLHVDLNGVASSSSEHISNFGTTLSWTNSQMGGAVATINVSTPGEHTLNVWMREDGTMLDKVVLTTSNSYTPSGAGPPPSPRTGATGTTTLLEDNFNDSGLSPEGARI